MDGKELTDGGKELLIPNTSWFTLGACPSICRLVTSDAAGKDTSLAPHFVTPPLDLASIASLKDVSTASFRPFLWVDCSLQASFNLSSYWSTFRVFIFGSIWLCCNQAVMRHPPVQEEESAQAQTMAVSPWKRERSLTKARSLARRPSSLKRLWLGRLMAGSEMPQG